MRGGWESRRLVSSGIQKCVPRRGGISVAVKTGERHEVSEKVGMHKAGMPNPESSDGNWVDWKKTRGEEFFFIWARILEC